MSVCFTSSQSSQSRPIWFVVEKMALPENLPESAKKWAASQDFHGKCREFLLVPDENGEICGALLGVGSLNSKNPYDRLFTNQLSQKLPEGDWYFANSLPEPFLQLLTMSFADYAFTRYKAPCCEKKISICLPQDIDEKNLLAWKEASILARDLIHTPSNDLGPDQFEVVMIDLAKRFDAKLAVTKGEDLLKDNFPLIYAVGKSGRHYQEPRLLDLTWGDKNAPKITLVGKGVCFDSGGLDIKTAAGMLTMKKDMGGAANVLALAFMIMSMGLAVRLRVLIPVVENLISQESFRPGDIFMSRKGLTIEIGNTDAEGRLILADALTYADEEKPDLLLDMATLTGAARVAMGPDIVPFYSSDMDFTQALTQASIHTVDPVWPMPLWAPYAKKLTSPIADLNNISFDGMAGSLVAALFLEQFVEHAKIWGHFDIFASTPKGTHCHPMGSEVQAIRAIFSVLTQEKFLV